MTSAIESPHLLNNYLEMVPFLSGEKEADEMKQDIKLPSKRGPYFSRWKIYWIMAKNPFEIISALFCKCISWISTKFSFGKTGRFFAVLSSQLERDWNQLCLQWDLQEKILVPAYNEHQIGTWRIFSYGDMPLSKIDDEEIKKATYNEALLRDEITTALDQFFQIIEEGRFETFMNRLAGGISKEAKEMAKQNFRRDYKKLGITEAIMKLKNKYSLEKNVDKGINQLYNGIKQTQHSIEQTSRSIPLYSELGLCPGASLWFIKLFLKSEHLTKNIDKQLRTVAEYFRTGVPSQGAILNGLADATHLTKLKKEPAPELLTLWELDNDRPRTTEKINRLENGIYRVSVYQHSFVFIKTGLHTGYVWNPSIGLFKMNGIDMLQMIYKFHYKQGNPHSTIHFEKYSLYKVPE